MKVAFLFDAGNSDGTIGGAELTMREFIEAAPEGAEVGELDDAEVVVVGNCVTFEPEITEVLEGRRVVRYHNDLARHEHPALREWLEHNATHIFTSPYHQALYGLDGECIPPAVDLEAFEEVSGTIARTGACSVGSWANPGKGQKLIEEWAIQHGGLDIYGAGACLPAGGHLRRMGELRPAQVPATLARYKTFVHLPTAPEPFGRAVVEAWAAGCELVINSLIGAIHYIQEEPEKLRTAADDFWEVI